MWEPLMVTPLEPGGHPHLKLLAVQGWALERYEDVDKARTSGGQAHEVPAAEGRLRSRQDAGCLHGPC